MLWRSPLNISIVVAHSKENAIGINNDIPWRIPSDLKNFKKITSGGIVIMGRKTFDSIPDKFKPLPNRRNIVLTRNEEWKYSGVEVAHSIKGVIDLIGDDEAFVIGGEAIYKNFLPFSSFLYISYVETSVKDADAYFPKVPEEKFPIVFSHRFDEDNDDYPYTLNVHKNLNFNKNFEETTFKNKLNIV
jgi:dihydrofolate reductase